MTTQDLNQPPTCPTVTRRSFLTAIGAGAAMVAAGPYGISVWGRNQALAAAAPPPGALGRLQPGRSIVIIEMGGGNDGLNMVVPHAAARYYDLRGEGAITDPHDLDGQIGLHPALEFLADQYRDGNLAVVEGVGYPDPDLSHFASMSTWWSGRPGGFGATGWLGRHLDGLAADPGGIGGVSIGPGPSPILLGERAITVSVQDLSGLTPTVPAWVDTRDELVAMWSGFAPPTIDPASLFGRVQQAIAATAASAGSINETLADAVTDSASARPDQAGNGTLSSYLEVAAALVSSEDPPPAIVVQGWGDFDTHQGQQNRHGTLMTQLNDGLAGFFATLEAAGVVDRALVMTTSEFGRRAAFNGSGTDHGTAASHLVIGRAVSGGRYGESPSLDDLDARGNLRHRVDYRSVYSTVLSGWIGGDIDESIGGTFENLGFLTGGSQGGSTVKLV